MFAGQQLKLALSGIAIGIVAALILTLTLSSFSHLLYDGWDHGSTDIF
jgi:hypothetical protein